MQLYCEHPVILVNHRLGYYLSIWRKYVTPNGVTEISTFEASYYRYHFPAYRYTPKRLGVTMDNIEEFNVVSPDGEMYPMFIAVPCSKCVLCRNKKTNDWSFRALCENVYSTSQPLFLTLTYNNEHLPKCGVFKEEVQLFMKRLRINLDRKGITHNIRYFACGEYGSKSLRPHYHIIFWNFPSEQFHCITSVLHFVECSWKIGGNSIGYAYCKPCDKGAISYVMKYMRKEIKLPQGKNKPFFLSSRKNGGLGAQFARDNKDFYWKNPQCLTMTVTDPYSGMEVTSNMPQYFKNLYFPSNSKFLDKQTRDSYKRLLKYISDRMEIERQMMNITQRYYTPKVSSLEKQILKKFSFLKEPMYFKPVIKKTYDKSTLFRLYHNYNELAANECRYLALISYDENYVVSRETMLSKRRASLEYFFGNKEPLVINDVKYRLIQAQKLAQEREII